MNSEISEKVSRLREQADALMSVNTAKAIILLSEAMNQIEADDEKLKSECGLQLALAYHKVKEELMAIKIINQCLELKINSDSLKNQIPFNELAAEIYFLLMSWLQKSILQFLFTTVHLNICLILLQPTHQQRTSRNSVWF